MMVDRRSFVRASAYAAGFLGLSRLTQAAPTSRVLDAFGPLETDPEGLLDLPAGFSYRVISEAGRPMRDGLLVPGKPDDMATFPGKDGQVILVRNHELDINQQNLGPFGDKTRFPDSIDRALSHDPGGQTQPPYVGGTTTLVYDPATGKVVDEILSLTGTDRNCSGGVMPWGAWMTCEEPESLETPRGRNHGYCFEVKADPRLGLQRAHALKGLGRFRHEAVALDRHDWSLYLTEDRTDGLLYRFVPERPGDFRRGKLFALSLCDQDGADLRNYDPKQPQVPERTPLPVRWIELDNVDGPKDDLRYRGFEKGAARFARGEGIYWSDGALYACCTDGGPDKLGQIYRILPRHGGEGQPAVELFVQPASDDLLTNGDNLCAAPNGDLVICEDLVAPHNETRTPHLRGVTPEGQVYTIARNARDKSEFAGSTFSPDGSILFVNMQNLGKTLAITGPWRA